MKLRTEIRGFADGTHYAAVKAGDTADAINHDAVCAHALMQAMDDVLRYGFYLETKIRLKQRAYELMREWGFDNREVEGGH